MRAALALIGSRGLRGLNVGQLARRVGLAPSAIYRHFKGKEEILDAALELIRRRLLGNVREVLAETEDSVERIHGLLVRHVEFIRESAALPHILFSEEVYFGHPDRKAKMYSTLKAYLTAIEEILREGQEKGSVRPDLDAATTAIMFLGLFQPAAMLWHMTDGRFDVTRHTRRAWQLFRESVAVESS